MTEGGHYYSNTHIYFYDTNVIQLLQALEQALSTGFRNAGGESESFDACVHTAGPFFSGPNVLKACIKTNTKVYVDVADPVPYLAEALQFHETARSAGTLAMVAGGAFPGLSNLLAMQAAHKLPMGEGVRDLSFNYFTAGLGGSGDVNLYITNVGFGEEVWRWEGGKEQKRLVAGEETQVINFGQEVGNVNCWAWPFPEGFTVGRQLNISGDSRVAMGTAPEIWNVIMGVMVKVIPRQLWLNPNFSQVCVSYY